MAEIQSCLNTIPADASVTASNTLVPHLSHRPAIYVISLHNAAEYIAVDPSTYDSFYAGEEDQLRSKVRGALAAGYGVACAKGTTLVLARVESNLQLTPSCSAGWPVNAAAAPASRSRPDAAGVLRAKSRMLL